MTPVLILTNATEDDKELTSPPQPIAAAHLAGFMGKGLTSGRLRRYPSSV